MKFLYAHFLGTYRSTRNGQAIGEWRLQVGGGGGGGGREMNERKRHWRSHYARCFSASEVGIRHGRRADIAKNIPTTPPRRILFFFSLVEAIAPSRDTRAFHTPIKKQRPKWAAPEHKDYEVATGGRFLWRKGRNGSSPLFRVY